MKLLEKWKEGPQTYLGMTVNGLPNMFMIMGPHQAYGNIPRSIEFAVDWLANCIGYLQQKDLSRIEAREEGVKQWTEHVHQISEGFLSNEIVSQTTVLDDLWMACC